MERYVEDVPAPTCLLVYDRLPSRDNLQKWGLMEVTKCSAIDRMPCQFSVYVATLPGHYLREVCEAAKAVWRSLKKPLQESRRKPSASGVNDPPNDGIKSLAERRDIVGWSDRELAKHYGLETKLRSR